MKASIEAVLRVVMLCRASKWGEGAGAALTAKTPRRRAIVAEGMERRMLSMMQPATATKLAKSNPEAPLKFFGFYIRVFI